MAAKRLLLLSTDMGMGGGAEEQVIAIAYGLQARGWRVMIVSMLPPSPMPAGFENSGISLEHLDMRRGLPSLGALRKLSGLIKTFRPHVVHSHMVHANLLGRLVRIIQPFPVLICTMHNLTMAGVDRDWSRLFETAHQITDGLCEVTTAICGAASENCIRRRAVPRAKMLTVHNGIDTAKFDLGPDVRQRMRRQLGVEDCFVWLAVGRLEAQKAYPTMLRALAQLPRKNRVLLICGQGSQKVAMEALAGQISVSNNTRLLGLRSDIPEVMSAADGFAMSSDLEGLPLVLLQAAAAGLPILATDVGGNADAVVDRVNGLLVPPGDPAIFARAMIELESMSATDRSAMGRAGQLRVRELFEAERVFDRWEQLYSCTSRG